MSIMSYSGFIRLHDNKQFSVLYTQEQTKKHRALKKLNWVIRFLKKMHEIMHTYMLYSHQRKGNQSKI